jgi:hypothetical protein
MSNWTRKLEEIPLRLVTEAKETSDFFMRNPKLLPFKKISNRHTELPRKVSFARNNKQILKRKAKARTRFDGYTINTDAQSSLNYSFHKHTPTFRLNSRSVNQVSVKMTPGPDCYFQGELNGSLSGPRFSFAKLPRDFKSVFGEDVKRDRRKVSLQTPIVNLDKYKTEKFIDNSNINEREIKEKSCDKREYINIQYEPLHI